MRIPILKLHNYLLVSIQVELDDNTPIQFQEDLLHKIHKTEALWVVSELTTLDMIDSLIAKVFGDVVATSDLMGAKVVLTGIQPTVAIPVIDRGIHMPNAPTALDLEQGLVN